MEAGDASTRARFESVVELVDRMDGTVGTLLAMARGDTSRRSAGRAADVVDAVLTPRPGSRQLEWSIAVTPDLLIAAPADLAARALAPLADNAARHARSGVAVSAEARDRFVEIIVSDDGAGVGEGEVEGIFEAGTRHADSDGAGLGLALSRRVARTLGGDVTLKSASSPTTFALSLPRF